MRVWASLPLVAFLFVILTSQSVTDAVAADPIPDEAPSTTPEFPEAPLGAHVLNGNCSENEYLFCHKLAKCIDLANETSYCKCPEKNTGDGLKNGTGCEQFEYRCVKDSQCHKLYGYCNGTYCKCKEGFIGNGHHCEDIDECNKPDACDQNAICSNAEGSFICRCKPKYYHNGTHCIFKCAVHSDCADNARCIKEDCVCNSGYEGNGVEFCKDIDECANDTHDCHKNAECKNVPGTFECVCRNGFAGDGRNCKLLPETCDAILKAKSTAKSDAYVIDPDGTGPAKSVKVSCIMKGGIGITVIYPSDSYPKDTPPSGTVPVDYKANPNQTDAVIKNSEFCYQDVWFSCPAKYALLATTSWVDGNGTKHSTWGVTDNGMCSCGKLGTCQNGKECNCDGNNGKTTDAGRIIDKDSLPVSSLMFKSSSKKGSYEIGPLKCGPKPFDIPKDCHEALKKYGITNNGPLIIDIDGPDGILKPVLVHCDMKTYPNLGITIVPTDDLIAYPPTTSGPNPVNYPVEPNTVQAIIQGSLFCSQEVEYECKGSTLMNGGNVKGFVNVTKDNRQLDHFPGGKGVPYHCACGITNSCDDPKYKCNCDIDDGKTRKDFGLIINKENLPVVSVSVDVGGVKTGKITVGSLKCGQQQFGIEPNCEKYRGVGKNVDYTYLIDPDGPKKPGEQNNVEPFPVQCVFTKKPPQGVTIINHKNMNQIAINGSNLRIDIVYLQAIVNQINALKKRSTYCTQEIKLSCNYFKLHPSGSKSGAAYWISQSGAKHYYFSGNGSSENCENLEDKCNCDKYDQGTDSGHLTNVNHVPLSAIDFTPAYDNTKANSKVDVTIGPLKCYETFPTCALLWQFVKARVKFGETMVHRGFFTIDPDGPGGVPPFQVTCDFPMTRVPGKPVPDNEVTNKGTDPVSKCFKIMYTDGNGDPISNAQITALVEASGTCNQKLSYSCTNAPFTNHVNYTKCNGESVKGWGGSGGVDKCSCGVTGTCEGGGEKKCNCDNEDNKKRNDNGWIREKKHLPVCEICTSQDGIPGGANPSPPSRSSSFGISELYCNSGSGMGTKPTCQRARVEGSIRESDTIYVGKPSIPAYCVITRYPPIGHLEIKPKNPETTVPPNVPVNITISYYVFNMTLMKKLIENSVYCEQYIYITCKDSALKIGGVYGWYGGDGNVRNYWAERAGESVPCKGNNGLCNCNLAGNQTDGGVIVEQSAFPISRVILQPESGLRVIKVGAVKCYELYKNCYEIMKSGNKRTAYYQNSTYVIDPDGAGGVKPFIVKCYFDETNDNAVTEVVVEGKGGTVVTDQGNKLPFKIRITYPSGTPKQANELAKNSNYCYQGILYECQQSPLVNDNNPSKAKYTLATGESPPNFGIGSDLNTTGCACGFLGTCNMQDSGSNTCRCDKKGPMDFDNGTVTAKDKLPIISATFGGTTSPEGVGKLTVTPLRCAEKPFGFPKDCEEAAQRGYTSGEIMINPSPGKVKPFLVYCDINHLVPGHGIAIVKPNTEKDTPVNKTTPKDVPYKGPTDEQLRALISVSKFCYQPAKFNCFQSKVEWTDNDKQVNSYWGSGDKSLNQCTCGAEGYCGGPDGKAAMSKRKCNCEIGDAKWRADAGVISVKEDLPIKQVRMKEIVQGALANLTIGDLYCGQQEFDLDECKLGFEDCHEKATCVNKKGSFDCICKKGYRGQVSGKTVYDLWANGRECADDDECSFHYCPYSTSKCTNTPGSFYCTCNKGYNKTAPTKCVDIDECKIGTHDCDSNARCDNLPGTFDCTCKRGYVGSGKKGDCEPVGICACFGDPHCVSFDQKWLHFQGTCQYLMARDNCGTGAPTFEVYILNWDQNTPQYYVSWVKTVTIKIGNLTFELLQNREVRKNGVTIIGYQNNGITVIDSGRSVTVRTDFGLLVTWDGSSEVEVIVPKQFQNKMCGFCGNFNQNDTDDWKIGPACPNSGQLTTNNNKFGNSWVDKDYVKQNPTCKADCNQPPDNETKCKIDEKLANYYCGRIFDLEKSPFSDCLKKMNPGIIDDMKKSCTYDICRVSDINIGQCKTAERLVKECEHVNVKVPDWQNTEGFNCDKPTCGENMEYNKCGGVNGRTPGPIKTCLGNLTNDQPKPPEICFAGCFCKEGFYLDGNKCVKPEDCGCVYDNGNYMKSGESLVLPGCGSQQVCKHNKVFKKEPLQCDKNAICTLYNGTYGCHCKEGFMGDGKKCEVDPCYNVTCGKFQECVNGTCQCIMGYQGDCNKCEDIDECKTQTHSCIYFGQQCVNLQGLFKCNCKPGFLKAGKGCVDINECDASLDDCGSNAECHNTPGGFECLCCDGFKKAKNGKDCISDGSKKATSTCCTCIGARCSRPGKVCGTDGVTYPTEKAMVVAECQKKTDIDVAYKGDCKETCKDVVCKNPLQNCTMENGKPECECPKCAEGSTEIVKDGICSTVKIIFKTMCDFSQYKCGLADTTIDIDVEGKSCQGGGPGEKLGPWSPWGNCSNPCGKGKMSRTRQFLSNLTDNDGNILKERQEAVCYTTCSEGPCKNNTCHEPQVCVVNEDDQPVCWCPDCENRELQPVCGQVGNIVKTYKNKCELQRGACEKNKDPILLEEKACEAIPVNCSRVRAFATRIYGSGDSECESHFINWGSCDGGCGVLPDKCCQPIMEKIEVPFICKNSAVKVNKQVEVVKNCHCVEG